MTRVPRSYAVEGYHASHGGHTYRRQPSTRGTPVTRFTILSRSVSCSDGHGTTPHIDYRRGRYSYLMFTFKDPTGRGTGTDLTPRFVHSLHFVIPRFGAESASQGPKRVNRVPRWIVSESNFAGGSDHFHEDVTRHAAYAVCLTRPTLMSRVNARCLRGAERQHTPF